MEFTGPAENPTASLTIGFLTSVIGDGTGRQLWEGIGEICQANRVNLLTFSGGEIDNPTGFSRQANMVFEMVDRGRLDGLIIWASSLAAYIGPDPIQRFCERYRPLPLVGIGLPLTGIPSVIMDSYQGEWDAIMHLVQEHGRRRLAFMRGPEHHREASLRYQAYQNVIRECGLEFDPDLVTPPHNWTQAWGAEAMRLLLEERGKKFDAVVAVNDGLAVGAMEYLQNRGVDIPGDVAVIGFDNAPEGRLVTPTLTTVPIRMRERGRQAVRMMLEQIAGRSVPDLVTLPTTLKLRQSCGCPDPLVVEAGLALAIPARPARIEELLSSYQGPSSLRAEIVTEMERALDLDEAPPAWAGELLDALLQKMDSGELNPFPTNLQRFLKLSAAAGGDLIAWQKVMSLIRARILPMLGDDPARADRVERYLHQARVMIGEFARRAQGYQSWRSNQQLNRLVRIRQIVSGAQDLNELMEILARELHTVGVRRCILALYENPSQPLDSARLMLAYDETLRHREYEGQVFQPSWRLTSLNFFSTRLSNLVVYPLYFRNEQLGLILMDASTFQDTAHQVLCEQISSAIKSVNLLEQNIQLYHQALEAQRVAEEANLLKSRFLSIVGHELLTPMVLLVGLSEMMLREGIGDRPPLPDAYRQDLTRIHASAQQLGSLVRDVLDLSRSQLGQLKLARTPVHLDEVLKPVILVGEQMVRGKGLVWRTQIPEHLPLIMGDGARLQQVALNLVSNAVKFTTHGEVALVVELTDGSVTVSIRDTGLGVPLNEQDAIFDEFRQSERTVARGYGGLGIGLAICRQLIEMQDGKIGVQSSGEENGGSCFYFTLPILQETLLPRPASRSQVVLILTNRAGGAEQLREHLVREGFQTEVIGVDETPGWPGQVLAAPPGAIILDMPVSDRGWELMELLKSNPVTQEIPVIFYSFLRDQGSGSMVALDYLVKPVAGAALRQVLARYGLGGGDCSDVRTVLIADDDPEILDIHARLVAEHIPDCRVLRAANGRIALDLMNEKVPSLVLLDLMMPELDGAGVIRAMQEDRRLQDVPVIVVTAQTLTQDEMSRLNRGVVAVLSKGVFTAEETLEHIDQALVRSKRLGGENQRLVRKVMAFIHEHYPEPLVREQMADYAGVSERHLNRCFLQETGLAPMEYLNRFRIQQAKCLLKEEDRSITEVMGAVGFSDSSYFTRVFRREVGISPSAYQRGERNH